MDNQNTNKIYYTLYITDYELDGKTYSGNVTTDGNLISDARLEALNEEEAGEIKFMEFPDKEAAWNYAFRQFLPCRYIDVLTNKR